MFEHVENIYTVNYDAQTLLLPELNVLDPSSP